MRALPLLMGIINVTPDSFSDGGKFYNTEAAIAQGFKLIKEGADILDIGGESTRPGAQRLSPHEEIQRIIPVISALSPHTLVSVDTRNAATMEAALAAGAGMINDINAMRDPDCLQVAKQAGVPLCLMHMQGNPDTMQTNPSYQDVVEDVFCYLSERIQACKAAGIDQSLLIADPGIGFGKKHEHNLDLIRNIKKFCNLEVKILLGVSRKSFIEKIFPDTPPDDRLPGSLSCAIYAMENGISILRVHDVKETKQALAIWNSLKE